MYTPKYNQQTDFEKETLGDIRARKQELIKIREEMQREMNCATQESIMIQQVLLNLTNGIGNVAPLFPPQFMNGPQFGFQAPSFHGNSGVPPVPSAHLSHCNHSHNLNPNEVFKSHAAINHEEIEKLTMFKRNALNFLKGRLEALEAAYVVVDDRPTGKLSDAVKLEIINIKDFLANNN